VKGSAAGTKDTITSHSKKAAEQAADVAGRVRERVADTAGSVRVSVRNTDVARMVRKPVPVVVLAATAALAVVTVVFPIRRRRRCAGGPDQGDLRIDAMTPASVETPIGCFVGIRWSGPACEVNDHVRHTRAPSAGRLPAMAVVLIAEDNEDVCSVLERLFVRAGFTVLTEPDGMAALHAAVTERPDVVLSDLDMPGMTGLQLCRAIRRHPALHDVPVAILSGSLLPGDPRAAEADVCRVLLKPFANNDLVRAVRHLVDGGRHDHGSDSSACPLTILAS
jgi:CheY-like chemotaxis protein